MRTMILRAIPVGGLLLLWAVPAFVILAILSLMSRKVARQFEEMMGGGEQ